jgi:hypothetical protein
MARTHPWEVSDELWKRVEPLIARWEKKTCNYLAFLHIACVQLLFAKVFG